MNETPDIPGPPKDSPPDTPKRTASIPSWLPSWLPLAGLAVLAAADIALWTAISQPPPPPIVPPEVTQRLASLEARLSRLEQRPAPPDIALLIARIDALEKRPASDLSGLETRLGALEKRPVADPAGLGPRVAALEARPAADLSAIQARLSSLEQAQAVDTRLAARVTALEARPVPDLAPLQNRIAVLEQKPAVDPQWAAQVDAVTGRLDGLTAWVQSADTEAARRLDGDEARLAKLEAASATVTTLADRTARLSRLQAIEAALAAGEPLGSIPGAPPALARFASERPPTEAALRLAFPDVERAIRVAGRPDLEGKPFLTRLWDRAQDLVTVRQGDQVLLGNTAAGSLARARTALDAGDLAGAIAALSGLTGDAAQAAAPWLAKARALQDARAALTQMVAGR